MYEKRGTTEFYYYYDSFGNLAGIKYYLDGTQYMVYAICNTRGDVEDLYWGSGNLACHYTYDSWGNVISITNADGQEITNPNAIGNLNPIRYRGYYYDTEIGMYYLQSRYYNPQVGRFINVDNQFSTNDLSGVNLFAYCGNNPVNRSDSSGEAWYHWAIGAAVVVACAAAVVVTAGGAAPAIAAVASVVNGFAAATTASTIAASAFVGSSMALGTSALFALGTSSSVKEFCDQGSWSTVGSVALGAAFGAGTAYAGTRTPKTNLYRSVSNAEANSIKKLGKFSLAPGGMESKQFGFNLSETRNFGNTMGQNTIVRAKLPSNMINNYYTEGVDTIIFRNGTLTVYGDELDSFNQGVGNSIKFME